MASLTSSGSVFPDNIDLYPADPELDAILAERVLGARVRRHKEWTGYENWIATTPDGAELYIVVSPHGVFAPVPVWNPSASRSDAQVLVEYLFRHSNYRAITEEVTEGDGYSATLRADPPVDNEVTGARPGAWPRHMGAYSTTGSGPTPALAVCRAVYKAASDMRPRHVDTGNR